MDKHKTTFFIQYNEDSVLQRKTKKQGHVDQLEMMHVFSATPVHLEKVRRKHFAGSNLGNVIGPVSVPNFMEVWRVTSDEKQKILGVRSSVCSNSVHGEWEPSFHGSDSTFD